MIEGQGCGQYGEDRILALVFRDQPDGYLVDVGAADGSTNSNTVNLLKRPGWRGLLIEPEQTQFWKLGDVYRDHPNVAVLNYAISTREGKGLLWCGGQVSTISPAVKKSAEDSHGTIYTQQEVQMVTLTRVLSAANAPADFDFLSIDAEGMDWEVWQSLDKGRFSPKLVCIEGTGYRMEGYYQLCQVGGNTFYIRDDVLPHL